MYKINMFSEKAGVPVKTLRYYDKIGLFKPTHYDKITGYRYYDDDQLPIIKLILKLKNFKLSLKDIKKYIITNDIEIIIGKKMEYKYRINAIEEFLTEPKDTKYVIRTGNYDEYLENNGLKIKEKAIALEIKDSNAKYYVIEKENVFYDDFALFNKDNYITLNRNIFLEIELLEIILKEISKSLDYITYYIPSEASDIIKNIRKYGYLVKISQIKQGIYKYKKIKIILKNNTLYNN